ncbi:MAG: sterol desaturase family protein [Alphaproteobacteria bacterium]|nr:sterol desaturase family protein [Rhodospirillales bacterium]MCW9045703.1 sterol desaturase family protein [Alphaproteobacteria bacterium]
MEVILANETTIRLSAFLGIFTIMAIWEVIAPCRTLQVSKMGRWFNNLGIVVLNSLLLRVLFPIAAVGVATIGEMSGWGLFNWLEWPVVLEVIVAVILLDFAIYIQHVMFHAIPALWRLHMIHHADLDYDVTTGARFHPVEIILSMGIKMAVVILLGPSAVAVILFEVLLNATAMFNHSNIQLPSGFDKKLRLFVVTPDVHRVHHSTTPEETNSNYGFNLPWWDRLMGTYRDQPSLGHKDMEIGLEQYRVSSEITLPKLLILPFVGKVGDYPINRR